MRLAKITEKELASLRAKAKSHDAYLEACRVMGGRQLGMLARVRMNRDPNDPRNYEPDYADGWLACLREFSQAVADAGREYDERQ